jgi:hypothetical protein
MPGRTNSGTQLEGTPGAWTTGAYPTAAGGGVDESDIPAALRISDLGLGGMGAFNDDVRPKAFITSDAWS